MGGVHGVCQVCVVCVVCVEGACVCDNGGCPQRQMCVSRFLSGNIVQHRHKLFLISLCSHIFYPHPCWSLVACESMADHRRMFIGKGFVRCG